MTSPPSSNAKLNIVPDTGFLIAATLKNGYARSYLLGRGSKFLSYQLYSSEAILLEFQAKLETKFGFDRPEVVTAIRQMRKVLTIVHPSQKVRAVRDPDDDKILECGLGAKADLIVTFDKDLLSMKQFQGIKIVHPATLRYMFLSP